MCVWNFWTEVKPLLLLLFQLSDGGPWALGWHGPTKTHPSCCAYLQLLNRDGMWLTQEPPCRFSTRITSEFELGTWTDEGDFWFIFLRRWCNLRLRWTSCPFHFFAYIVGFFVASFDFILFFKVATKEFSFHSTPNPPVRCQEWSEVFARQTHSTSKFDKTSLSQCVTHVGSTRCREPLGEYLSR